ncbi:MAG: hypothetical protein Ct9H90mP7_5100 [Candidatus Neomarinimicrobiota bacterium]|nr:MAG: hypothetical protein Ct9H90mP7_5100 [Candidatus Neomarinimicrobiota bacterium]
MKFDSITSAVEDIKKGKCIIVVDNEDRENEGTLWQHQNFALQT